MRLSAGPVAYSPTECDDPGQRDSRKLRWGYVSGAVDEVRAHTRHQNSATHHCNERLFFATLICMFC